MQSIHANAIQFKWAELLHFDQMRHVIQSDLTRSDLIRSEVELQCLTFGHCHWWTDNQMWTNVLQCCKYVVR